MSNTTPFVILENDKKEAKELKQVINQKNQEIKDLVSQLEGMDLQ